MAEVSKKEKFDVLDMHNYRMEKLPVREKSKFENSFSDHRITIGNSFLYIDSFSY